MLLHFVIPGGEDGDRRQGHGMEFARPILSPSIFISVLFYFRCHSISRPKERMVTVGKGWTWRLDFSFSPRLSYSLCPSIWLSLPLYLTLSAPMSLIPGGGDGDRRQGLGASGALAWRSCSPSCALFSISSYTESQYITTLECLVSNPPPPPKKKKQRRPIIFLLFELLHSSLGLEAL
jgi:hypothetical protein